MSCIGSPDSNKVQGLCALPVCRRGFPPGAPVSSHSRKARVSLSEESELSVGVSVSANGCL